MANSEEKKEAKDNAQMLAAAYKTGIRAIVFYADVVVGYPTLARAEKYAAKARKKGSEAQAYAIDKDGYIRVHHCPNCSTTCPKCGRTKSKGAKEESIL
jgi:hypothetical protein